MKKTVSSTIVVLNYSDFVPSESCYMTSLKSMPCRGFGKCTFYSNVYQKVSVVTSL